MRTALVLIQGATFVALAGVLALDHAWRLAAAQFLLAIITGLVYL